MSVARLLSTVCDRCTDYRTKLSSTSFGVGTHYLTCGSNAVVLFQSVQVFTERDTRYPGANPQPRVTTSTISLDLATLFQVTTNTSNPDNIQGAGFIDPVDSPGTQPFPILQLDQPGTYIYQAQDNGPWSLQSFQPGNTFSATFLHRRGLECTSTKGNFYAAVRYVYSGEILLGDVLPKMVEAAGNIEEACPSVRRYFCQTVDASMDASSPLIASLAVGRQVTGTAPEIAYRIGRVYLPGHHRLRIVDSLAGTSCQNLDVTCQQPRDVTIDYSNPPERELSWTVNVYIDWDQSCPP